MSVQSRNGYRNRFDCLKLFIKDSRSVYSGTYLKWLAMGRKFVAVIERWLLMEVQMYAIM